MSSGGRSRRRKKIFVALAAVVATLGCLEAGVRVYDAARGRSWNARTAWYWMFERDPFLGYRGRADVEVDFGPDGVYRHNADGFRDARTLREARRVPGARLVLCVGESSTYGSGARTTAATYPARLEARLRALSGDERFVVYDAGLPAYSTQETVALLQLRLLKHRPEAVVLMNLRNDVEFSARVLDETTVYGDLPIRSAPVAATFLTELGMRSALVGFVATRFANAQSEAIRASQRRVRSPVTPEGRAFYTSNLARAALLCARAGARMLVVDQPVFDADQPVERRAATADLRRAMHAVCAEVGAPVLDADRPLHDEGFVSPGEVHLGEEGYDRLAAILAPQLRALLGEGAPR